MRRQYPLKSGTSASTPASINLSTSSVRRCRSASASAGSNFDKGSLGIGVSPKDIRRSYSGKEMQKTYLFMTFLGGEIFLKNRRLKFRIQTKITETAQKLGTCLNK